MVLSEFSGTLIPISSEAWRHECEVAFLLGLPAEKQDEMLNGRPGTVNEHGIRATRGEQAVAMLRSEMKLLARIRAERLRASNGC